MGLKERVDSNELPGFVDLIDDWFDPKTHVDQEQFVRRFLHVFKQSEQDDTYQKLVGDYDNEIQDIFNDFVDGKISAQEAAEKYYPFTTSKVPQNRGLRRTGGLQSVIPGERSVLAQHTNLLEALPKTFPSRIRSLVAKVAPALKDPSESIYVPVCIAPVSPGKDSLAIY